MTDNTDDTTEDAPYADAIPHETNDDMTEQIEASFGPMTVYVSGTDTQDVQDTFDHVWDRMMDTSETMRDRAENSDDSLRSGGFN